jgi:hypothetical protein
VGFVLLPRLPVDRIEVLEDLRLLVQGEEPALPLSPRVVGGNGGQLALGPRGRIVSSSLAEGIPFR